MQQFLDKPSIDFGAVRDGRRSMPLWLDIDLTAARSIAASSALSINIAGNSFYVDQDTTNVGFATVHFQDTNLGSASAPIFVSPGFIGNVPFTQILIENAAQPGKRLRIFYGVDLDFQAGVNASITISGTVNIGNAQAAPANFAESGLTFGGSYKSNNALAVFTPDTVFLPAANINGAIVHLASFAEVCASTHAGIALIAKTSAPANLLDGDVILSPDCLNSGTAGYTAGSLKHAVKIPAGKGVYFISSRATSESMRSVLYTLL